MSKPCDKCGGHCWAHDGYCLTLECAGNSRDEDWPLSKATHDTEPEVKVRKKAKPRSAAGRRSAELYYEQRGTVAPWLQEKQ